MNLKHLCFRAICSSFVLFGILLFKPSESVAQSPEIDSLVSYLHSRPVIDTARAEVLSRLSYLLNSTDPKRGLEFGEEALKIANMVGSDWSKARAFNSIGVNHFALGETDLAIENYQKAVEFQEGLNDDRGVAMTRVNIGLIYWRNNQYASALREYIAALDYFEESKEENVKATIYLNQGQLYKEIRDETQAMNNFQLALAIGKTLGLKDIEFTALTQISILYREQKNYTESLKFAILATGLAERERNMGRRAAAYNRVARGLSDLDMADSAIFFHNEAIAISKRYYNRTQEASGYFSLGNIYRDKKEFELAKQYYENAMTIYKANGSKRNLSSVWFELGRLHEAMGLIADSRSDFIRGMQLAQESGSLPGVVTGSEWLASSYEKSGNFKKALEYSLINQSAKDSLQGENRLREFAKLESQFVAEREKQRLLSDQERDEAVLNAEIAEQKLFKWITTGGAAVLLVVALIYYRFYRTKTRINLSLKEKSDEILRQKEAISNQAQELQEMNTELKELGKFKTGVTQMIAHDMKNPLNTIIGLSESKLDRTKAKDVTSAGYQLLHLVTNMLDVDKYERAELEPKIETAYLDELVLKAKRQVELLMKAKNIHLQNLIPKQILVKVDNNMITRVIVNLLTNAIKYSKDDGIITISLGKSENGFLELSVRDHGEGIPADKVEKIFDKFWSSGNGKAGVAMSTGLGLTFCKMAVEAHGGKIWADSELGTGATLVITLPVVDQELTEHKSEEDLRVGLILEAERLMIEGYSSDLKELKVYQVGDINKILKTMEDQDIKSPWKSNLEDAIFEGDQSRYDELVSMSSNSKE